jgi:hypothetical protein
MLIVIMLNVVAPFRELAGQKHPSLVSLIVNFNEKKFFFLVVVVVVVVGGHLERIFWRQNFFLFRRLLIL